MAHPIAIAIARLVLAEGHRALLLAALCSSVAVGCGGHAYREREGAQGTSGAADSGSGGGAADPSNPAPAVQLDDETQWFVSSPMAPLNGTVATDAMGNAEDDKVLQLVFDELGTATSVSTSMHFDAIGAASTLRFAAQAKAPLRLEVSVARDAKFGSYFAARDAGQPWPSATVTVGTPDAEWHDHVAQLAEMMPPNPTQVKPLGNLVIGFTVLQPDGVTELRLDKIRFE